MTDTSLSGPTPVKCTRGCGCYTTHEVDGQAVCVFCEDGVPCPAAKKESSPGAFDCQVQPSIPKKRVSRPAPNQAKERSRSEAFRKEPMPRIKKPCKHCGIPTASKVGYCGKHFYISKLVHGKPAPLTGKLPISVSSRVIAPARISLSLTEEQLDDLLVRILFGPIHSMSTAQKIELLIAHASPDLW